MIDSTAWWHVGQDGACHAFSRFQVGQHQAIITTLCNKQVPAYLVERAERAPKCLACLLLTGSD